MTFRFGWGARISLQFALVVLPLAVLLVAQAWLDVQRSTELAAAFPVHLQASAARKHYRQFVDGVTDAVDSGKLSQQATAALEATRSTVHAIAQNSVDSELQSLDGALSRLVSSVGTHAKLETLLPLRAAVTAVNAGLQRLDEDYEARTRAVITVSVDGARREIMMIWIAGAAALGLAIFFVRGMIGRLTAPLHNGIRIAQAIARGDLSAAHRVRGDDETAQLLNALSGMTDSLRDIVGKVHQSSAAIHSASGTIARGNRDLSMRTEKTGTHLQQTARSVEQITQATRQSAGNASRANQLASAASDVAGRGGQVIGEVVSTMGAIETSSQKIREIIRVIDSIAFQTNILALNAAVEAARAGEQGRGFAVVASEVRALAHRSADAAREIKALIEESVQKVHSGAGLVVSAGQTMTEIVEQVRSVSRLIAEINAASTTQASEVEQLQHAIGELDRMTQQNMTMVAESATASESMKTLAASLAEAVSLFRIDTAVEGTTSSAGRSDDRAGHTHARTGSPALA